MAKKLYVGNLPHSYSNDDLQNLFEEYGTVVSAQIIMDRDTGRSKGFGFVEFESDDAATAAIEALDGSDAGGRTITVNEARPRPERPARRGGPGGGSGGPRSGPGRGGFGGGGRDRY